MDQKTTLFIIKAKVVHKNKYSYDKTKYVHSKEKIIITCPIHGDFEQKPNNHLNGQNCPKCSLNNNSKDKTKTNEQYISEANIVHENKYSYDKTKYIKCYYKIIITCPIHGDFEQRADMHLFGCGCPKCGIIINHENQLKTNEQYIYKAKIVHENKYSYDKTKYINSDNKVIITCPIHGDFEQRADSHLCNSHGPSGCPKCNSNGLPSKGEQEIADYIKSLDIDIETSNRTILSNKQELDIYIPSKNLAIEYNGLYWHSELHKDKKYHLQKTEDCLKNNIRLIHIFEDEWVNKTGIVKSRLSNLLGVTKYHTYARKTELSNISYSEANNFLDRHHIQGSCNSNIQLGLFQKDKLLAVMTFGSLRKNVGNIPKEGHYELLRFCNFQNLNIVGGASKLLNYFIKNYRPKEIISYCDRRWSEGNLYEKLGFTFSHNSTINYFYVIGLKRKNRFGFRKNILVSDFDCPETMTEKEFCFSKGWYRIYDCGTKVYKLKLL